MKCTSVSFSVMYRPINVNAHIRIHSDVKYYSKFPDSKVHGANMGPIWGRRDPDGPHVGPMNFAIWVTRRYLPRKCKVAP